MDDRCLLEVTSHVDGKNAQVRVYPDRVEWSRKGMSGGAKAALGVATMGLSLAATGVKGRGGSEMIPIKSLTSVTTKRDKFQWNVTLIASGNTIEMRVSKGEAEELKRTLTQLMLGSHPSQRVDAGPAPPTPPPPPPPPAVASPAPPAPRPSPSALSDHDVVVDQIRKLAELHDAGIVSDAEFETKKQELLGRF